MAYMQVFEGSVCVMLAHVLNGLPLHLLRSHKVVSSQQVCGHRALHAPSGPENMPVTQTSASLPIYSAVES